ncbi:tubulin polyglutamylase TTLL13 isoform X1 [Drosophila nasuta]|uniref:tubulin polyglutamylase TTLL13 isoform X1 n=1 Tax=Drosophila nasuta TaxID=42062 RepID=UPI00295F469F|nr:tubulin polyglutamylase TTLL13 isoform X1 [Drosophila nasuta]
MNLKNSKFYKRIQTLRHFSKEKILKERTIRTMALRGVEMALSESQCNHDVDASAAAASAWSPPLSSTSRRKSPAGGAAKSKMIKKKTDTSPRTREKGFKPVQPASDEDNDGAEVNGYIELNKCRYRVACSGRVDATTSRAAEPLFVESKSTICVSNSRYAMIGRISRLLGYKLVKESKLWNILWSDSFPGVELFKNMKRFQQINHFPGMIEICRKDLLSRNLNRMLKLYPHDYKIFPKTWMLPADYGDAMHYALNHKHTFILKPDSGAQGRGIWLTNDLKTIGANERLICQTYVYRPLLIDGYKFDLRVYTLITSVDPLRIYVYNEGLARFATNKYVEPTPGNANDLYMHLTNYSVNKRNSQYDLCDNDDCGSKRKLSAINNWMTRHNYDVAEFWSNVDDVIIKTVLSAWPVLKHNYHACFPGHDTIQACFEILGFDILVDWKLKPYILEVNHSPSFHTNEQVDREVKRPLIRDTLTLVSTVLADKKQILREDRKRVKQRLLKSKGDRQVTAINAFCHDHNIIIYYSVLRPRQVAGGVKPPTNETNVAPAPKPEAGSLAQQVAWEESHLGNFRRIMPPQDASRISYYSKFYAQSNQVSIFQETAASKKREDLARKMRLQIEEKRAKAEQMLLASTKRKRPIQPRSVREKHRQYMYRLKENWIPGFVSEAEERLRHTWQQMRSEAIKNLKITENIYALLYELGHLSNTDITVFPSLYHCLQIGYDIKGAT